MPTNDAQVVIDKAIAAFGGPDAREILKQGLLEMQINTPIPGLSEEFGADTVKMVIQYEFPDLERRVVSGVPAIDPQVYIMNSGTLWLGNQDGVGNTMPAPPPETYEGPPLVNTVNSLFHVMESYSKRKLRTDSPVAPHVVIHVFTGTELSERIFFDKVSSLPVRIEKFSFDVSKFSEGDFEEQIETATTFSDYKRFGSVTLPTRVTVEQAGNRVLDVTLVSADFESPIDKTAFKIPE